MGEKKIIKNTSMLLIFQIAKILFPFITLPYLTRVFSTETYGAVAYVKTVMNYMQIIVDFGFVLSATKDIVNSKQNKRQLEYVIGDTLFARGILGIAAFILLLILTAVLPILRNYIVFTFLSYIVVFESIFLMDFLFRGLEIMHIITIRFILMKTISTVLTFIMVHSDKDLLLIPIFDILSSLAAVFLVFYKIKKLNISICFSGIKKAYVAIKDSFMYFLSNVASTSLNAFSTLIIGIALNATEVAYWSICMQIIGTVQACCSPISDGIYPEMIRSKDFSLIKKVLRCFLPLVMLGCVLLYFLAPVGMLVLGGKPYLVVVPVFRLLIPSVFFGFLAIIFGWPTLGAIGKTKETTTSTVVTVIVHILLLIVLIAGQAFNLVNIAIVRVAAEILLFIIRFCYYIRYRTLFLKQPKKE